MKAHLAIILFMGSVLVGCIDEFTPENVPQDGGMLVVDGNITDGTTVISLTRSIGINEDFKEVDCFVRNATIYVEDTQGRKMDGWHEGDGVYKIPTGILDKNLGYRLRIDLDGQQYESEFLTPVQTDPIDELTFLQKSQKADVEIMLSSSHDSAKKDTLFYLWSYREDWEVVSPIFASSGWANIQTREIEYYDIRGKNTYYCWGKDTTSAISIASNEQLLIQGIQDHPIRSISAYDDRISELYHITVYQNQLHKDGYDYRRELKENVEKAGGIFSPVFAISNKGNISCRTTPSENVIGFVDVSMTTRKDLYITQDEISYQGKVDRCNVFDTNLGTAALNLYYWVDYKSGTAVKNSQCVDCRTREKASKNKPSWWPNDHV